MIPLSIFTTDFSVSINGTGGVMLFYKVVPRVLKMVPFLFRGLVTTPDDLTEKDWVKLGKFQNGRLCRRSLQPCVGGN